MAGIIFDLVMRAKGLTEAKRDTAEIAADSERIKRNMAGAGSRTAAGALRRSGGDGDGASTSEYRTQRSAAGTRGAAGRNFSGLAQASGESSGVVAAYATVAANVFALTAAFKALSDAAKFEQLKKGLEEVGARSGTTLSITAKKMQELSGYALSTVETMKSVASATAAGFSSDEIERLTRVAKGASVALGRDMSDSMDRLMRGTIKLEPELLDELGIMTRIDEATRRYALQNKLTASSLTLTQKNQAFLNAVLAEGEKKFGDIADSVDTSMYDKLSASIRDLGTGSLATLNNMLNPLITLLIDVPALGLIPLMGILSSASGKLIPDFTKHLDKMAGRLKIITEQSNRAKTAAADYFGKISDSGNATGDQAAIADRYLRKVNLSSTDFTLKGQKQMIVQLLKEEKTLTDKIAAATDTTSQNYQDMVRDLQAIKAVNADISSQTGIISAASKFDRVANKINQNKFAQDASIASAQQFQDDLFAAGGGLGVFKASAKAIGREISIGWNKALLATNDELIRLNESTQGFASLFNPIRARIAGLQTAFSSLGSVISTAFQGIQAAAGWIFVAMGALSALGAVVSWIDETFFNNNKELKEARTNFEAVLETAKKTAVEIEKMQNMGQFGKAIDAASNSMTELLKNYKEFERIKNQNNQTAQKDRSGYGMFSGSFFGSIHLVGDLIDEFNKVDKEFSTNVRSLISGYSIKEAEAFTNQIYDTLKAYDSNVLAAYNAELIAINNSSLEYIDKVKAQNEVAKKYAATQEGTSNIFKDMALSAKAADDEISKLRLPDSFNTPYKKVADSAMQIATGFGLASDKLKKLGADLNKAEQAYATELFNVPGLAQELGILQGNLGSVLRLQTKFTAESAIQQDILTNSNLTTEQKNSLMAESNVRMKVFNDELFKAIPPSTIMLLNIKNMKTVLAATNLQLAKTNLQFAELQVSSMKTKDSIARTAIEIGMMKATGTSNFGPEYAALKEIDAAEKSYEYAKKTYDLRVEIIKMEAAAAEAKFQYEKEGRKITLRGIFGEKASSTIDDFIKQGKTAEQAASLLGNTGLFGGEALNKDMQTLFTYYYNEYKAGLTMQQVLNKITGKTIENYKTELTAAEQQITLAREKAKLLFSGINIDKEQLNQSQKLLALSKEAADLAKNQRQLDYNKYEFDLRNAAMANRTKFGPQEEYQLKVRSAQVAIDNAIADRDFLIKESKLKMDSMKLDNRIRLLELDNAVNEAIFQAKRNSNPETWGIVGNAMQLRADVEKNQQSVMNATGFNNFIKQNQANTTVTVAENASRAILTPVQEFLTELETNINELRKSNDRLGLLGNVIGIFDRGVANTAKQMSQDPKTKGMDPTQILAAATAMELATAETELLDKSMESLGAHTSTLFQDLIDGTISSKEAFKKMASAIIGDIGMMISRILILRALSSMFGAPTAGTAGGSVVLGTGQTYGEGGAITAAAGGILPMASGGIMNRANAPQGVINKPTYLVGEGRYNEAVVPLPNGRAIPVQMHGNNTSSNNVQVTVNLSQSGEAKTSTQGPDMNNLGAVIASAVQKELLAQKAPGGILSRYGVA